MGLAGLEAIGLEAPMPHKTALVFIETDGCFADGIEVATGASVGHRTLKIVDTGKVAAVFANVGTRKSVRLAPRLDVRQRAPTYAPGIKQKYYAQLKGYQIMPIEELFTLQKVLMDPDIQTVISRPGMRVKCCRCGEEIMNERQLVVRDEILCLTCAGAGYYREKVFH